MSSPKHSISPKAFSIALLIFSIWWFVSAGLLFLTNRVSKDGWNGTPLVGLLGLCLSPLLCVTSAVFLILARKQRKERFNALDWISFIGGLGATLFGLLFIFGFLQGLYWAGIFPSR